jgi:transcription antitermination factor NusG
MRSQDPVPAAGWLALVAVPQLELLAERVLASCGYQVWVPRALVERRHRGRRVALEVPLWPGYVLVRLEPRQCLEHVLDLTSILDVVRGEEGRPAPIAAADMARVMAWADPGPVDLRRPAERARRKATPVWLAGPRADRSGCQALIEALGRPC